MQSWTHGTDFGLFLSKLFFMFAIRCQTKDVFKDSIRYKTSFFRGRWRLAKQASAG